MKIAGREIGEGHSPFIVAELSANHNRDYTRALAIMEAAKVAGADGFKLQLYDPERLAEARGGRRHVLKSGPWAGRNLLDLYTEGSTPREWFFDLFDHAKKIGIIIFSSVFDEDGVEFLERLECPAYKVSSFELRNHALIAKAAATGKPVILSTGMASDSEIRGAAIATIHSGASDCALLHCVSAYPCPPAGANLPRLEWLRHEYSSYTPIGFSDHTLGTDVAVAATALGACIIEKHLTLSREDGGLDASFSAEPKEFKRMVDGIRNAWLAVNGASETEAESEYRGLRQVAA